ncbi:MAG: hypothetical protein RL757_685 [Bacteroidota bacterium]|jgi:hypothetical protein
MAKSTSRRIGDLPTENPASGGNVLLKNHLFVITINDYLNCPKLFNPVNDGDDFISLLTSKYQFEAAHVVRVSNEQATERNILNQLRNYAQNLTQNDNLILLFSGHGTYDTVFNQGYWVPVDAKFDARRIDTSDCIANSDIMTAIKAMKAKHIVLIADACFSGSLAGQRLAGVERLEDFDSRWLLTAGRNEPVLDGEGDHSPFMTEILDFLDKKATDTGGHVRISELGQHVTTVVARNETQIPICTPMQDVNDKNGEFFFRPRRNEAKDWEIFKALNTIEGFQAYLKLYPNGKFSTDSLQFIHHLQNPIKQNDKVKQGSVLYNIPNHMLRNRETRCVVRVAFDEITLRNDVNVDSETVIKSIRVSEAMTAELIDSTDGKAFTVRTLSTKEQFVDKDSATEWLFLVTPLVKGEHILTLKIGVLEEVNGKERTREMLLEEKITVVEELAFDNKIGEMKKMDTPPIMMMPKVFSATAPSQATSPDAPPSPSAPEQGGQKSGTNFRSIAIGGGLAAILLIATIPILMETGGLQIGSRKIEVPNKPESTDNGATSTIKSGENGGQQPETPVKEGTKQPEKPQNTGGGANSGANNPPKPAPAPKPKPTPPKPKPIEKPQNIRTESPDKSIVKGDRIERRRPSDVAIEVKNDEIPEDLLKKLFNGDDINLLKNALEKYPKSQYRGELKKHLEVLERKREMEIKEREIRNEMPNAVFEQVKVSTDIKYLEVILLDYPKSKHVDYLRKRLAELKAMKQ